MFLTGQVPKEIIMIITRNHGLKLIRQGAIAIGLTCNGARWPLGSIFVILDCLDTQRTYHFPATEADILRYSALT